MVILLARIIGEVSLLNERAVATDELTLFAMQDQCSYPESNSLCQ